MIFDVIVILLLIALVIVTFGVALYTLVPGIIELDKWWQERKKRKREEGKKNEQNNKDD